MTYTLIDNWPDLDTWIAELESGNWHQLSGFLEGNPDKAQRQALKIDERLPAGTKAYCCLGVGCVLARGSVPEADDQTIEIWEPEFDAWIRDGEPHEEEWPEDMSYSIPGDDIYVPAGHYLNTRVLLEGKETFNLVQLVVDANDIAWDGAYTQVINVLKMFRDGVRRFAFDSTSSTYRAVTE